MKKAFRAPILILVVLALGLLFALPASVGAAPAVLDQVAFVIDGSGSIGSGEWALMIDATATMIEDPSCIPRNSTVELTIIQFAEATATLEVPPTVIDSQTTAEAIANDVRNIVKRDGFTPTGEGLKMAKEQIVGSPNFDPAARQVINLITNGHPEPEAQVDIAIAERNAAIAAGIDEIDSEAIGVLQVWLEWLRDNIVYPELGVIAPPYPDPPGSQGFVRPVENFDQFAEALMEKCARVFLELVLAPQFSSNVVGQTHTVVATHTEAGNPVVGETITFDVMSGPHAGETGQAVTDANGQAFWSYTGTGLGTDTIVATTDALTSNQVEKEWIEGAKVPGITTWGILAAVTMIGLLIPMILRRRALASRGV